MHRDEYQAIKDHPLRGIITSGASRHPPTHSAIAAMLDQAGVTDPATRETVTADVVDLAEVARDGANLFHLRQDADQRTLNHVKALQRGDDLFGESPLDDIEPEPEPAAADVDKVRHMAHGMTAQQAADKVAADAERDRLAKLGVHVA